MTVKVGSIFKADDVAPYCLARHVLGNLLPGDFVWDVGYSVSKQEYNCYTKVPSNRENFPYELGVNLRFKVTKDCELYASELLPSQKYTTGTSDLKAQVSGTVYRTLKEEILPSLSKKWHKELAASGVYAEFN